MVRKVAHVWSLNRWSDLYEIRYIDNGQRLIQRYKFYGRSLKGLRRGGGSNVAISHSVEPIGVIVRGKRCTRTPHFFGVGVPYPPLFKSCHKKNYYANSDSIGYMWRTSVDYLNCSAGAYCFVSYMRHDLFIHLFIYLLKVHMTSWI